jgi:dinuclear metal center YbgI/SA1388 family protein
MYHAFFVCWEGGRMTVKKLLEILDQLVPFHIAETWDNSGLQAGHPDWNADRIMIALDVSLPLMEAAKKSKCNLVLTHHPLMMDPEKSLDFSIMPGSAIQMAAQEKISIISVHTNLDKATNGLNDYFSIQIGLENIVPFLPHLIDESDASVSKGIGRMGQLSSEMPVSQAADQIKKKLALSHVRVIGDMDKQVSQVAVCTGSGGSLVNEFLASDAQMFVTGDIKYHEARMVEAAGKALIDVGHYGSEYMAVELLSDKLDQVFDHAGLKIKIETYVSEKDPFNIV